METDGGMNSDSSAELTPRRRRKYSETPPEEPEEKRQKFLERNRQGLSYFEYHCTFLFNVQKTDLYSHNTSILSSKPLLSLLALFLKSL